MTGPCRPEDDLQGRLYRDIKNNYSIKRARQIIDLDKIPIEHSNGSEKNIEESDSPPGGLSEFVFSAVELEVVPPLLASLSGWGKVAPPIGAARARLFDLRTCSRTRRRAHRPCESAQTPRIHPSERPRTATLISAHRVLLFDLAGLGTYSFHVGLLSSISVSRTNEPNGTSAREQKFTCTQVSIANRTCVEDKAFWSSASLSFHRGALGLTTVFFFSLRNLSPQRWLVGK